MEMQLKEDTGQRLTYKDSTYEIVSKVAYLIGVPQKIFENEHEPPKMEIFRVLDLNKNARIVRNLCILRTAIERNFKRIHEEMRFNMRSIFSLPNYVPYDALRRLADDGISISRNNRTQLVNYVVEINRLICDRINNCKSIFPTWINWDYIRELFIMPGGLEESKTKEAAAVYGQFRNYYPYQVYINWIPADIGNILFSDKKFVTLLYSWHGEEFRELGKISDAGSYVKGNIYDFVENSRSTVVVVDCENVDPYKLSAALKGLKNSCTDKITSIILFDDIHASTGWDLLEQFTNIPVEHIETERVKENKSLVDMKLAMRVSQEFYEHSVDSFVLVSSDSDYWALISSLPKAKFLVMIEREKCGPDLKNALAEHHIFYCYLDDFYSGKEEELKVTALLYQMTLSLKNTSFNLNELFQNALDLTRITMAPTERQRFYDKYIKPIQMEISEDGTVSMRLKMKG